MTVPISILIRTFNSAKTLDAVLNRLDVEAQDEILVVDSGSTDATLAIAESHQARILKGEKPFNYGRSLNQGFREAKNPWVLVLSSHCLPVSADLLAVFRQAALTLPERVAVIYGDFILFENPKKAPAATDLTADQTSDFEQRQRVYGGNAVALYRRERWQEQPFDETLPTGEDMNWFLRLLDRGGTAARLPTARVLYRNQGSLRHMFGKGWQESRMARKLTGVRGMNLWELGINLASLLEKWATSRIPASTLWRHGAHAVGAYLAPKFRQRKSGTGPGAP